MRQENITENDEGGKDAKKMKEKGERNGLVSMEGDGAVIVTEDGQDFLIQAPKLYLVNSVVS